LGNKSRLYVVWFPSLGLILKSENSIICESIEIYDLLYSDICNFLASKITKLFVAAKEVGLALNLVKLCVCICY